MEFFVEKPIPVEPLPKQAASHGLAFEFVSDESEHYTVLRDKLYRVAARIESELEREKGKRVSYDEAIIVLIERARVRDTARVRFRSLYGTLGPDSRVWVELRTFCLADFQVGLHLLLSMEQAGF
jgi:hypothetical protein